MTSSRPRTIDCPLCSTFSRAAGELLSSTMSALPSAACALAAWATAKLASCSASRSVRPSPTTVTWLPLARSRRTTSPTWSGVRPPKSRCSLTAFTHWSWGSCDKSMLDRPPWASHCRSSSADNPVARSAAITRSGGSAEKTLIRTPDATKSRTSWRLSGRIRRPYLMVHKGIRPSGSRGRPTSSTSGTSFGRKARTKPSSWPSSGSESGRGPSASADPATPSSSRGSANTNRSGSSSKANAVHPSVAKWAASVVMMLCSPSNALASASEIGVGVDVLRAKSPISWRSCDGEGQSSSSGGRGAGVRSMAAPDSNPTSVKQTTFDSDSASTDRALCTSAPIFARSAVPVE